MSHFHRSLLSRRMFVQGVAVSGLALAGAGALPRITSAQDPAKVTLALDWYPNANHAGIYMALDRGYFADAGLDVEVFTPADPTTVLQTVGAGRDTFGISYMNDVLQARGQDVPVVSVAAFSQHPLNCLMVLASSDIQTPADLKGKTVGMAGVPADEAAVDTILRSVGLTMDDIETVDVGYDLMPAVLSGRVDAVIGVYWTHETILAEQEGTPVRYFKVQDYGVPDYYELVMVAGESTIADREAVVRAMCGAMRRGYEAAAADLDGAISLLVEASPDLDADVERKGIELLAPMWTDDGKVRWGTQVAQKWEAYAAWAEDEGFLEPGLAADEAFRDDLFPDEGATPEASPVS
ncbi:MAG TPA: ABC transporter substrate-binding protein [Thermomicrobiales bacterium]|nr:ABC transporter substrate-binding protein [Thermomicrobiales bacterium]